jgi:hypothetical protein
MAENTIKIEIKDDGRPVERKPSLPVGSFAGTSSSASLSTGQLPRPQPPVSQPPRTDESPLTRVVADLVNTLRAQGSSVSRVDEPIELDASKIRPIEPPKPGTEQKSESTEVEPQQPAVPKAEPQQPPASSPRTTRERIDKRDATKLLDGQENIDLANNAFTEDVKRRIAEAIAEGAKVVMRTDGGKRRVELDGDMRDLATGKQLSATLLLLDQTGKEFIEIIRKAKNETAKRKGEDKSTEQPATTYPPRGKAVSSAVPDSEDSASLPEPMESESAPANQSPVRSEKPQPTVADADIELDASKPRGTGPSFDPSAEPIYIAPRPEQRLDDFQLDASKGAKFKVDDDEPSPIIDPKTKTKPHRIGDDEDEIELDASKPPKAKPSEANDPTGQSQPVPKWIQIFNDIAEKLAKNLLTVKEAQERIDRLVASRRDDITDTMRQTGQLQTGDDPADVLKKAALEQAKNAGATPQVGKADRPVAMPKSYEQDAADRDKKAADFRKKLDEQDRQAEQKRKDAEDARQQRNDRFARQVGAVNTGLYAGLQGGATAKVGAAVQIAGSGLLGSGAAAAAGGPVGIAAVGGAAAIDAMAEAAKRAKRFLDEYAERGERLKGFSSEISTASALAQVARLQADIREAQRGKKEFAGAIDAQARFDIAFREALQPLERVGARLMASILNDLVPLMKRLKKAAENGERMYDVLVAIKDVLTLSRTPTGAAADLLRREQERIREREAEERAPADILENFFRALGPDPVPAAPAFPPGAFDPAAGGRP